MSFRQTPPAPLSGGSHLPTALFNSTRSPRLPSAATPDFCRSHREGWGVNGGFNLGGLHYHLTLLRNTLQWSVIKSFRHTGLEVFYTSGNKRGIQAKHAKRLRMQLAALDTACVIGDIDIPGYRLHKLIGDRANIWSIKVSVNWRLTFGFTDGDVNIINYEDYH